MCLKQNVLSATPNVPDITHTALARISRKQVALHNGCLLFHMKVAKKHILFFDFYHSEIVNLFAAMMSLGNDP